MVTEYALYCWGRDAVSGDVDGYYLTFVFFLMLSYAHGADRGIAEGAEF